MASTTIDIDTELSAVNTILGAIGQSPITQINYDNPEISFIFNLLKDANIDTQAEGWHFNTEKHVAFAPDANGHILYQMMFYNLMFLKVGQIEHMM